MSASGHASAWARPDGTSMAPRTTQAKAKHSSLRRLKQLGCRDSPPVQSAYRQRSLQICPTHSHLLWQPPEPNSLVLTARNGIAAIGREGHTPDPVGVVRE